MPTYILKIIAEKRSLISAVIDDAKFLRFSDIRKGFSYKGRIALNFLMHADQATILEVRKLVKDDT